MGQMCGFEFQIRGWNVEPKQYIAKPKSSDL